MKEISLIKMHLRKIIIVFGVVLTSATSYSQTNPFTIFTNPVCIGREIPPLAPIIIDPLALPKPCINYSDLTDLNYDLIFEDNFDTPTMDLYKWKGEDGGRANMFNTADNPYPPKADRPLTLDFFGCPGVLPENFDLTTNPGSLRLIAKQVPTFWDDVFTYQVDGCTAPDPSDCLLEDGFPNLRRFNYTSGILLSERNFKYGYFEMRCKIPDIEGIFPAFWLFEVGGNRTEIDFFEFKQDEPGTICSPESSVTASQKMFITYHDWQGLSPTVADDRVCESRNVVFNSSIDINDWHTYALYWDEFKMIWIFDTYVVRSVYQYEWIKKNAFGTIVDQGNIVNCEDLYNAGSDDEKEVITNYYWPDEQCKLIVDMWVPNFGGPYNPDPSLDQTCASLTGSSAMEIDYIRVYGIRACNSGDYYFCSDNPTHVPSQVTATDNLIIAGNCDVIVQNDRPDALAWGDNSSAHYMDATAGNEVNLWPGFWAQEGAEFRASIQDCETADLRHTSTGNDILSSQQIKDKVIEADRLAKQKDSLQNKPAEPQNIFEVYPNPTSGTIQFDINEGLTSAVLLDITGAIVLDVYSQVNNKAGYQTINLNSLSKGVYVLRISTETNTYLSQKIILN